MAKATRKQALGRGLSALLKDPSNDISSVSDKNADQVIGNIIDLPLDAIEVNPFQPRSQFNDEALEELGTSIAQLGVIQPITVRKLGYNKYQLVSGERRYRASKRIGLQAIPAYVRIANDQEALEMALVENIQRQDLDPIEIALSYKRLIDEINLTQEALSSRVGKKRSTIANYLRLLKLDPIIQTGMRDGFISMGHGRAIINIDDSMDQINIYKKIIAQKLSVRETEALVQRFKSKDQVRKSPKTQLPEELTADIEVLKAKLGRHIGIRLDDSGKGKLNIAFSDMDELKQLLKMLGRDD